MLSTLNQQGFLFYGNTLHNKYINHSRKKFTVYCKKFVEYTWSSLAPNEKLPKLTPVDLPQVYPRELLIELNAGYMM